MDVTSVIDKIREYIDKWNVTRIVVDSGGIGRMIVEEIVKRYGIPAVAAEKSDKLGAIELMNGDLYSGRCKVLKGEPVLKEWDSLIWDVARKVEDPRFPNDLHSAALYAYREAIHWLYRQHKELGKQGTELYYKQFEEELEEETEEFEKYQRTTVKMR
jgi:hypothetical protein